MEEVVTFIGINTFLLNESKKYRNYHFDLYYYRLNGPQRQMKADLLDRQQQHWLNNHTRAVFLEFSVYNSQVIKTIYMYSVCSQISILR